MPSTRPFLVYQNRGQWLFTWFWRRPSEPAGDEHGPYPFRWAARLAGLLHA